MIQDPNLAPTSEMVSLDELVQANLCFHVPIYQRLYVWGSEQINTLLEDLAAAFEADSPIYYLGGTLVVEGQREDGTPSLELIDGQQRFTTLWMMSLVWGGDLRRFVAFSARRASRPRLTFPIRPDVDEFFARQMRGERGATLPSHPQILDALATIQTFPARLDSGGHRGQAKLDPMGFSRFLMHNVHLVLTRVPPNTDLNRVFEAINSRGTQLQHHEILKAKLLAPIPNTERRERDDYATLWDACAYMDNYVEKNLQDIARLRISEFYEQVATETDGEGLGDAAVVLAAVSKRRELSPEESERSLDEVLDEPTEIRPQKTSSEASGEYEAHRARSIISFSVLLQHTLRIWLQRLGRPDLPRIADGKLLDIFSAHFFTAEKADRRENAASFVALLWEVRYCFDKHVIKWVETDDQEQHLICRLYANAPGTSSSLQRRRPDGNDEFSLLQSMLYHSQQITTQYWLTPLLAYLHAHRGGADVAEFSAYLRHLDNHLLCSDDGRSLAERSRLFLEDPWSQRPLVTPSKLLKQPLGTAFPHYWFYKLEFILWFQKYPGLETFRATFRMTAKNSVEHISPQTAREEDSNVVPDDMRDAFGNLALVSRSLNSEFGNKTFAEKRAKFRESNKTKADSLKMALIYANPKWGPQYMEDHQQAMFDLMDAYLKGED